MTNYEKMKAAAEYIRAHVSIRPTIGLVLGSGLGGYADTLENAVRIPYSEIPNFPIPTIPGHSGYVHCSGSNRSRTLRHAGSRHKLCYKYGSRCIACKTQPRRSHRNSQPRKRSVPKVD